jgi:hypothetical protein
VNPNDFNTAEPSAPASESHEPQDVTMPLGTGEFGDPAGVDLLAGATARKSFNTGSVLVIAVVLIAVGGLFSMRMLAQVTAATAIDADIETTIEDFLQTALGTEGSAGAQDGAASHKDNVIAVLKETYSEQQVPLHDVQRDPFVIYETASGGTTLPAYDPTADELARRERQFQQEREARRLQFEQAGGTLRVKSVLGGGNPLANINGDVVRVGDVLHAGPDQIEFRVTAISTASVDLVAEDERYDLAVTVTLHVQQPGR